MKKVLLFVSLLSVFLVKPKAQELVTLTAPVSYTNTSAYHLAYLILDVDNLRITAVLKAPAPAVDIQKVYDSTTNPTGSALLHTLNTSNFTTNSLIKAAYNRLISDGVISGTISGTPQH